MIEPGGPGDPDPTEAPGSAGASGGAEAPASAGASGGAEAPWSAGATVPGAAEPRPDALTHEDAEAPGARRPLIERLGLFAVAVVLAAFFGGIALALLSAGELFLGIMAAIGCAMTLWVGGLTLVRG